MKLMLYSNYQIDLQTMTQMQYKQLVPNEILNEITNYFLN